MHHNPMPGKSIPRGFVCRFGRRLKDASHPTCRSCQSAGVKCGAGDGEGKEKRRYQSWAEERDGKKVLVATFDLKSLNTHVNKPNGDRIYRGYKAIWQRMIGYRKDGKGSNIALLLFGAHGSRKRRLEIIRYIRNRRSSFDSDNLVGACKSLVDSLVLAGVLKDDRPEWLDRVPPVEMIDREHPRVEIIVI